MAVFVRLVYETLVKCFAENFLPKRCARPKDIIKFKCLNNVGSQPFTKVV